jgi:hypothetical protein
MGRGRGGALTVGHKDWRRLPWNFSSSSSSSFCPSASTTWANQNFLSQLFREGVFKLRDPQVHFFHYLCMIRMDRQTEHHPKASAVPPPPTPSPLPPTTSALPPPPLPSPPPPPSRTSSSPSSSCPPTHLPSHSSPLPISIPLMSPSSPRKHQTHPTIPCHTFLLALLVVLVGRGLQVQHCGLMPAPLYMSPRNNGDQMDRRKGRSVREVGE